MVFRSYELKKNILWKIVPWENQDAFISWIKELQSKWWIIKAIVTDWKKWSLWCLPWIPSQMCQFHQKQIIQRYLTKNPILEANKELLSIAESLGKYKKQTIKLWLSSRYERYKAFLEERNEINKIIHTRTKSAYKSLRNNLEYLYTYEQYRWIIKIPNTTNSLESTFSWLKTYLWVHRWLNKERKIKFIFNYLSK